MRRKTGRKTKRTTPSGRMEIYTSGSKPERRRTANSAARSPYSLAIAPGLENFIANSGALSRKVRELERNVTFTVAPKTMSGDRVQAHRSRLYGRDIEGFRPQPLAVKRVIRELKRLGFKIVHEGTFGIAASGSAKLIEETLKIRLAIQARPRQTSLRATQNFALSYESPSPEDLYVAPVESLTVRSTINDYIDDFIFTPPPLMSATLSTVEPSHSYFGIDATAIRRLLSVPDNSGGDGIKIAIIDTGFFKHPYYSANQFRYRPTRTRAQPAPESDIDGHGTTLAYNVFAVAPRAIVMGFKKTEPPEIALEDAFAAGADIISCSWGWDREQTRPLLELVIKDIIAKGSIVLFSSGNGELSWPGSMSEILSIGGVYVDKQGQLEASNYASGFVSSLSGGRRGPDVCGLCGQKPKGIYITLPCPPNSDIDKGMASGGQIFPGGDETKPNDGWICASGTSSATPQIAGVIALMVEKARAKGQTLTLEDVRTILKETATPVERGNSAQGVPAVGHPNVAVGFGLVNAAAALARI
jgi:serine protease AprX